MVIRIMEEGFCIYKDSYFSCRSASFLTHHLVLALVPAPGPALLSFIPLEPLVGLLYLRMEVSCPRPISLSHYKSD